ncbi:MAG: Rrf2 family transcriptional regulator [Candidatus Omnitrophota bacterium]|nr:Rrf2 family transcriptional regulator [Candidatus Omnitrophota bacterium]
MKLSTKGRYGTRLMLDLALHFGQGQVLLKDIARRQGLSEKYLWHLINPLKNAGLVVSNRGIRGGYVLARAPDKINIRQIVEVLEGELCLVDCVHNNETCNRISTCVTKEVWELVTNRVLQTLESFTLQDLVDKQKIKSQDAVYAI